MPLFVIGEIQGFAPVNLAFAWVQSDKVPLILGQTNFFMKFDVCFYRSLLEFEIRPNQNSRAFFGSFHGMKRNPYWKFCIKNTLNANLMILDEMFTRLILKTLDFGGLRGLLVI